MILCCSDFVKANEWSSDSCCKACHAGELCLTKASGSVTVNHCCTFSPKHWVVDNAKACEKVMELKANDPTQI